MEQLQLGGSWLLVYTLQTGLCKSDTIGKLVLWMFSQTSLHTILHSSLATPVHIIHANYKLLDSGQ